MSAYFVPTRFIWRFGGQVVSLQPEPICKTVLGCKDEHERSTSIWRFRSKGVGGLRDYEGRGLASALLD